MTLAQYKKAIEQNNIVSKTDIEGIITFVNDEFCNIFEYSKEELIGKNHNIIRHPDVPKKVFENLWDTIKAKKTYKATVKNLTKSGKTVYVNTTVIPMINKQGDIEEFIAIRYDITKNIYMTKELEQKELELELLNNTLEKRVEVKTNELKKLNLNLENKIKKEVEKNRKKDRLLYQQSRLAAMGEMIGNIAHQWRQPLSELGITIYKMKKLFTSNGDENIFLESYDHSREVIKSMSSTIEDFRNFFNPNRVKDYFLISEAVSETLNILGGTIRKYDLNINVHCSEPVQIEGYLNEFIQVLINLINNSKDAFVKNIVKKRYIDIEIKRDTKNNAIISFSDNAKGIDEKIIDKIFDPYFTTKHSSTGTGLGLYMSKTIVKNSMNGDILVNNLKDGVTFSIILPLGTNNKEYL
ncbi:MAG: PAS domain S-box protein [Epsilonproteobacteria bacterium]|nr:PAS domain S-box protein [Campylobacterota bacterium]